MADDVLQREIHIAASPATVFAYLTEPLKMMTWMGIECDFAPEPGGAYRCNVDGENVAAGEVVELVPDRRVVYSWGWEGGEELPPGASRVEITLEEAAGGTRLTLRHSGLSAHLAERHGEGWDHYYARLAIAAAGGDPGPDPWIKTTTMEE
ncbi:MAG: SRPBCC domain-containing protein [Alphaproteobacteria bacterium]|jgi:uncharacterized protein YndB with AHSA1/START domain|nr:SRPBCC domain-containing protein [Alphaproteobacteria bacterium]